MDGAELSKGHHTANRLRVLRRIRILARRRCAGGIRASASRQSTLDRLTGRRDDAPVDAIDADPIAGFDDGVSHGTVNARVYLIQKFIRGGGRLNVRSVIDEVADRYAFRELRHAAKVIGMPVCR